MLKKIVSGGQTGADQAGLRAAKAAGIETGGWAPHGWTTEKGPAPWLADYGLAECPIPGFPARTEANVRDSDATVWFGRTDSPGFRTTTDACRKHGKPWFIIVEGRTTPKQVIDWLTEHGIATLNVAGNRESNNRGLALRTERFLELNCLESCLPLDSNVALDQPDETVQRIGGALVWEIPV
jgi:hypothetical protein